MTVAEKPTPIPNPMNKCNTMSSNQSPLDFDTGGVNGSGFFFGGELVRVHFVGRGQP
jgi:hypothetical protein